MALVATNKQFYRTMLSIAAPVALQNVISFSVNLMDTLMLGKLGEVALSASSLANQMFFLFNVVCFGVGSGAIVLTSQYWGKKDSLAIQKITGMALKIITAFALLLTAVILLFPTGIMRIFTPDPAVVEAGAKYLRIVCLSYVWSGISTTFMVILRSVGTVKISVWIYTVSFCVNVFFNYMFIFGKFGAPALGVSGAAVGTVLARISEVTFLCIYLVFFEKKVRFRFSVLLKNDKMLLRDLIHYGLPVMINEFLWGVGTAMHAVILGHMGATVVAANSICSVLYQLTASFIFGIGSASAVMTGNIIGEGDIPYMHACVKRFKRVYLIAGLASSALLLLLQGPMLSLYNIEPETRAFAGQLMLAYAGAVFFMAYTCPLITGVFRGGGDTHFAAVVDTGCLWFVTILGFVLAFAFRLPPMVVFICLKMDYPLKTFFCLVRLRGDRWIRNVTR